MLYKDNKIPFRNVRLNFLCILFFTKTSGLIPGRYFMLIFQLFHSIIVNGSCEANSCIRFKRSPPTVYFVSNDTRRFKSFEIFIWKSVFPINFAFGLRIAGLKHLKLRARTYSSRCFPNENNLLCFPFRKILNVYTLAKSKGCRSLFANEIQRFHNIWTLRKITLHKILRFYIMEGK